MLDRRLLAVTAAALFALPASAGAAQITQLRYSCKYPLVGAKTTDVRIELDLADQWPLGGADRAIGVKADVSAYDLGLIGGALDGVTSIDGASTLQATVRTAQGTAIPLTSAMPLTGAQVPEGTAEPDPYRLTAAGTTNAFRIDDPGVATITLDRLALNLVAQAADGPVPLPPVTKDLDGNPVSDSDGNPDTFDVYCRLASPQDLRIGQVTVGDGPLPSPTATPTPLPSVAPSTPTPTPTASPTPTPAPTRTPSPGPDTTPPTVPGAYPNPPASDVTDTTILVRWLPSDDGTGKGLSHYRVNYEDRWFTVPADQTSLLLTGLDPETDFDVFVYAVDKAGNMSLPLYSAFTTLSGPAGTTPTPTPAPTRTPTPTPSPTPTPQPPARYAYSLQGTTTVQTLSRSAMPLTGSVDMTVAPGTGFITADVVFNDTQARLTTSSGVPATATVGFVTSGAATGTLHNTLLSLNTKVRIKVKSVKAFGAVPLAAGNTCQTKSFSEIRLNQTAAFVAASGGPLAGSYDISDLNGCGAFDGLVSPVTAGTNLIAVRLTSIVR